MDFKKVPISPRAPAGFRLSTFDEATRHFLKLTALQIIDDLDILRLLDGVFCNCKEISIDDNSWPVMNMLVFAKSPTIISNDSSLLRRELYSGVNLRVERKVIALRLSCMLKDIEVVHWLLLQLEPKPQFKEYLKQIVENEGRAYFSNFLKILKILLRSVQIRETKVIKSLEYAVKDDEVVPDNALAIAEILLDECREARSLNVAAVVDSQIQRLANMTVEANIAEPKRIGILAKLLSECGDRLQNNHGIIESNFSKLLREATRRGYDQLTYALLRLKDAKYELEKDDLLLHYAAKRGYGDEIVNLLGENCRKLIYSRNNEGKTPLHVAAMWDNGKMVKKMKEIFLPCEGALKVGDFYGQTPLHLAASNGDEKTVQVFLDCGSDPFERDMRGRTALHHAVTNKKSKDTPKRIVEALLDHLKCNKKKALLLWISATDIGTADEAEDIDPQIKEFLVEQKSETYKDVNF